MQSIFLEELLHLFFVNCNNDPKLFIRNFNPSNRIIAYNYRCSQKRFTHVSTSFKTILGYRLQNILTNGNFTSKLIHPQDKVAINDCLKSAATSDLKLPEHSLFYQFNQIKCRVKHIRGYWKYFVIYAKGYWNEDDRTNDKIGLIVDERVKSGVHSSSEKQEANKGNNHGLNLTNETSGLKGTFISPRENEVLEMISNGYLTKEIASKLNISDSTVVTHRKNLISKLHVRNTAEMIKKAARHMLI